jgi:hypothetical protein
MNKSGALRQGRVIGAVLVSSILSILAFNHTAEGTQMTYAINANGAKEVTSGGVPNQGDLDGSASGTLTLDNGTGAGSTGSATFSITLSNIDITTLTGHHIHMAPATTTGSIVLDFGDPDTLRTGSVISGTISNLSLRRSPRFSRIRRTFTTTYTMARSQEVRCAINWCQFRSRVWDFSQPVPLCC